MFVCLQTLRSHVLLYKKPDLRSDAGIELYAQLPPRRQRVVDNAT